ncbi:MAG: MBL fold metallo-hydrolase [Pseudomonadales bacterium]|nr:MBL fold metallo-hydrolase [Pseudomonadales bacterium]
MSATPNTSKTLAFTSDASIKPLVVPFFDLGSHTFSYVLQDPASNACAVIDSVMEFDYSAGKISYVGADRIIHYIDEHNLELEWILETHVHADHLSAAPYIQDALGGNLGIGKEVVGVQETFGKIFNEGAEFQRDGSQFDRLFEDGDTFNIGQLEVNVIHTPGHTPACVSFVVGDSAFVGDTMFMPDAGTARADFPGGDARELYHSIQRLLLLPDETRVFMCHDYGETREVEYETTIKKERDENIHVNSQVTEDEYVTLRETRDAELDVPHLILPSLQVNMRAGHLPPEEDNGRVYFKLPINLF